MSSILKLLEFQHIESLTDFSKRYNIFIPFDTELNKLLICQKTEHIPSLKDYSFPEDEEYCKLFGKFKQKCEEAQTFTAFNLNSLSIFQKIFSYFKEYTVYLLEYYYLFYNWDNNSLEPIIDHLEINEKLIKGSKTLNSIKPRNQRHIYFKNQIKEININLKNKRSYSNKVNFKLFKNAIKTCKPCSNLPRNNNDPFQESLNLKKILYDSKEKPQWPVNHILSNCDSDKLFLHIVQLPISYDCQIEKKFDESNNCHKLQSTIDIFIKNHKTVEKRNGYGRILKRHLKNAVTPSDMLVPISKSIVASYLIDILRKVVPLELFGCNRLRKKFFFSLIKIISASKEETLIWHSILFHLIHNKSSIPWCSEITDSNTQKILILKLFKFLITDYLFVILKNNFYITETSLSGFGIRFYKKCDIHRASSFCLKKLFYYKHLRSLKKRDREPFSIERKWIDTGIIDEKDFNENTLMYTDKEYIQRIANIRFLPKTDWNDQMRIITYIKPQKTRVLGEKHEVLKIFENRLTKRREKLNYAKLFLECLVDKIGLGIKPVPENPKLEAAWEKAIYLKEKFGKLYFIKADIADAFDSVRHDLLIKILKETWEQELCNGPIQIKKITEWKRCKRKLQKISRMSFNNQPQKNSILINRSILVSDYINSKEGLDFIEIIKQVVTQQRVEIKGKIFKLIKGLAQGSVGKFSHHLCEIYYSSMDKSYFGECIESSDCILLRGVDDYLFISSDIKKAERFLGIVRVGIQHFNVRFNNEKLISNLIQDVHEVPYLGLVFNFDDMSVKPNYCKLRGNNLLSTIKLIDKTESIHFNKIYFLEKKSLCMNSVKLQTILLNNNHNTLQNIRRTIFQACLIQSLRIMTLAKYIYNDSANNLVVWRIIIKTRNKLFKLIDNKISLDKSEVDWLFFYALMYIFQKFSGQFKHLLVFGRFELQKCKRRLCDNSKLVLSLIKNDLHKQEFWKKIQELFGTARINTKPFRGKENINFKV